MNANPKFNIEAAISAAEGGNAAMWEQVARHLLKQPPANDDLCEQGDSPELRATYPARCEEWRARQERARKATLAYEAHRNRNGNFTPPKNKEPRPTYKKAYYEGGFRMVIDGVPIRMAAHVKKWKKSNRDALCQGYDAYGLTLRPHNKRGFTDLPAWGERVRLHHIEAKDCGPCDASELSPLMIKGGYDIVAGHLLRRSIWCPEGLSHRGEDWKKPRPRTSPKFRPAPDLFTAARVARRLAIAA